MNNSIIKFVKSKDFKFIEELGSGACGKTIKLYDEVINETFVCKKYEPYSESVRKELFDNFIQEIKFLYLLNHKNIVRVFNYYIYPDHYTGYIIMEYIKGTDIENYLVDNPQNINDIFNQCIAGFLHLERCNILHRDIRPWNILISNEGELKIIDFGFSKKIVEESDFNKSISLNWWCEPPNDFKEKTYDYRTEVYFVGKLFEKIIKERDISVFKYLSLLSKMCNPEPQLRIASFSAVNTSINEDLFFEIEFNDSELEIYREFSGSLANSVTKINYDCKYFEDSELIQKKLEDCYRAVMLEEYLPSSSVVTRCFLNGTYYYNKNNYFPVHEVKGFIELIRSCSKDKKNIIINNLCSKLDAIERYSEPSVNYDDVPF